MYKGTEQKLLTDALSETEENKVESKIIQEIEIEELSIDGICGVY